jgi:hypothetical protein
MERERLTSGNGEPRAQGPALGGVARDVVDHAAMIGRDWLNIGKLEARRYGEHLRRDVATRVAWGAVVAILAALAGLCGIIALFWGIAVAIGSVAWTFVIFAALFAVLAMVAAALSSNRAHEGEARVPYSPAAGEPDRAQMSRTPTGGSTSLATFEAPRKT